MWWQEHGRGSNECPLFAEYVRSLLPEHTDSHSSASWEHYAARLAIDPRCIFVFHQFSNPTLWYARPAASGTVLQVVTREALLPP